MHHQESKLSNILVTVCASGVAGVLLFTVYLIIANTA